MKIFIFISFSLLSLVNVFASEINPSFENTCYHYALSPNRPADGAICFFKFGNTITYSLFMNFVGGTKVQVCNKNAKILPIDQEEDSDLIHSIYKVLNFDGDADAVRLARIDSFSKYGRLNIIMMRQGVYWQTTDAEKSKLFNLLEGGNHRICRNPR